VIGGQERAGHITVRCEDTPEHPNVVPGGCLCGDQVLNPCAEKQPHHDVDRRQCFFDCTPVRLDASAAAYELRCPDGSAIAASDGGCQCGGQIMNPCGKDAPQSVDVSGSKCLVTCRK
jgi:hypothetical protein